MGDGDDAGSVSAGVLGSLEHAVMRVLWSDGRARVGEVLKQINAERNPSDQLAYTTVMTVLARLSAKGIVERKTVGRGYVYTPRFTEDGLMAHLSGKEVSELVARYGPAALAQFAAALDDADPDMLARLAELAAEGDDE